MKKAKLLQEITELKEVIEQNEIDIKDYLEMYELSREELKTVKGHNESLEREVKKLNTRMDAMVDQSKLYEDNQKFREVKMKIEKNRDRAIGKCRDFEKEYKELIGNFSAWLAVFGETVNEISDEFSMPYSEEFNTKQWLHTGRVAKYDELHSEKTA
jgi:chromosome segregation ATPase